jgi:hypothetical protein
MDRGGRIVRRRFYLPPETTDASLVVTSSRDLNERAVLAVWKLDLPAAPESDPPGLAWSNAVDGWFQYVPATSAGRPTPGPWVTLPAVSTLLIDLRHWPDRSSVDPGLIDVVMLQARVRGSHLVASTLGEAV